MAQPDSESLKKPYSATKSEIDTGVGAVATDSPPIDIFMPPPEKKRFQLFYWLAIARLVLVVFSAIFANLLPVKDPNTMNILIRLRPPGPGGLLGSDELGRDILSRLVYGARVSLIVSLTAVLIGSVVGGFLGLTAGFYRGWYERLVMAVVDLLLAFPALVLMLALVAFMGQSLQTITFVMGFLTISPFTRVARAATLSVSQREYVLAARAVGATDRSILFRELLPNVAPPIFAFGLVALGVVIVAEGSLAFLGLSVKFPTATWGSMIAASKTYIQQAPFYTLIPSLAMFFTVLSVNYVGDQLRQRFDVRGSAL